MGLSRIISCGQTGVDRGALDAALDRGLLNVAGPSQSEAPRAHDYACEAVCLVLARIGGRSVANRGVE